MIVVIFLISIKSWGMWAFTFCEILEYNQAV